MMLHITNDVTYLIKLSLEPNKVRFTTIQNDIHGDFFSRTENNVKLTDCVPFSEKRESIGSNGSYKNIYIETRYS
jgi:hypothetical protein